MIQEAIRSLIESKLNDNTVGKEFIVGSYAYLEDKGKEFVYNVKNGYKLIETNFIPSMMVFTCDYKAIPLQINGNASISITFLLSAETQADMQTDLDTLDEFVSKIIGNNEDIVDGTKTYHSVWNMSALIPAGLTDPINGVRYIQVQTTVYVGFSDTNHFGNEYEYRLNDVRIYPYDVNNSRNNEENNPHRLGDYESKGGNSTSVWTSTLTVLVSDFISSLVDMFSSNTYDMEKVYNYNEITPTNQVGVTFAVKIQSAVYQPNLGELVLATITFFKSDDVFEVIVYTITYVLDSGTNNAENPATFMLSNLPITLLEATKSGYEFVSWRIATDFFKITTNSNYELSVNITGDITSAKVWDQFITTQYGSDAGSIQETYGYFDVNNKSIRVTNETHTEYWDFNDWIYEIGSLQNITVYAQFRATTVIVYTITYVLDGGTNSGSNVATFSYEDLPVLLYAPTKTNYTFDGWFNNALFTGVAITSIATMGNVTLYAKWVYDAHNEWETSDVTYWNEQNVAGNAGTFISSTPSVSPDELSEDYIVGFAARVSNGTLPVSYYYYKVIYVEEEES
ncbi:MAG: InlB B-repeat-containing protein [Clostridia bacterium]|jgi:uncharacterized repeat protein (TIGR02543 family)|nr:InlB B-repeat-containing protein [Clostridia bacterium]